MSLFVSNCVLNGCSLFSLIAWDAMKPRQEKHRITEYLSISFHRQIHPKISPFSGATVESSFDRKISTFF